MYQSIYYDFKSYTYFLRTDDEGWTQFQYKPTFYERVNSKQPGSLSVLTGGWAIPTKKYDKSNPNLLEVDINKELVLLRDKYYQYDDKLPKFHNLLYLDIETEIAGALTPEFIRSAPVNITAIALLDKSTKQKICFILDKTGEITNISQDDKIIISCKSEVELIQKFLNKYEELDPTILCTYNGQYFDIPYLYYRIKKLLGESEVNRLSPIRKINVQQFAGEETIRIGGVNHLDFMLLIKKYFQKEEPSYKLKDIGFKYGDIEKIEYEGNLNNLFKTDKETFINYNIRDVEILEKLEEKLKFIDLTVLLSHICNIPYDQIYYNTVMNEGAILKFLKRKGIVSPNKPTTTNFNLKNIKESYAGGFIKEPSPGLYEDVIDLDFTSLYPSIIKSLNLGIETLIGRIKSNDANYEQEYSLEKLKSKDPNGEIILEKLDKKTYKTSISTATVKDIIDVIEQNKYTVSAAGGIFRTDVKSACSEILEGWFEKREHYRALKKKAGNEKDWVNYKLYDLFQHAFKILQNAMYGTYAINGWRYSDGHKICSASITNSGQRLTQDSIVFVNNYLNKKIDQNNDYIIISDTDSLYICLNKLLTNVKEEDKIEHILKLAQEIQSVSNENLKIICEECFNIKQNKYFQLKQEVIAKSILVTGKRRYGMFLINKEGVNIPSDHKDALDLKGLEVMKSNMNPIFKKFGEKLIKSILFSKPKHEIDNDIITFYRSLRSLEPKLLGRPTGISYIKKYTKRKPSSGEIFTHFESGAPVNTKAAIRYNDLLKFKKLDTKYEGIIEGDKMFIVNLLPNPYQIETIAIPNGKTPDEIEKFIQQYIDVDEIFESILLKKLKELYSDIKWSFPSLNPNISKFFSYD